MRCNELADVVVSGLEALEDDWELLSDDVSDGELGKDIENSLVVVSDTGCKLAG